MAAQATRPGVRTVLAAASGEEKSESMDYLREEFVPWHIGTVI